MSFSESEGPGAAAMRVAGIVRDACLEAAREGYERAAMSGLCHEGAMELSLDTIRSLDLEAVLAHGGDAEAARKG